MAIGCSPEPSRESLVEPQGTRCDDTTQVVCNQGNFFLTFDSPPDNVRGQISELIKKITISSIVIGLKKSYFH